MYKFTKIYDAVYTAFHKTEPLFEKFDLSHKTTSSKHGIGYNFNISKPDPDLTGKYIYICEIEIDNPLSANSSTIPMEKWFEFQKELGLSTDISFADPNSSDYANYALISNIYSGISKDYEGFLKCVRKVLGVDGLVVPEEDLLVSFDSDKIKIKEVKNA